MRPSEKPAVSAHQTCPSGVVVMPCGFDLRRTMEEAKVLTSFPGWTNLAAVRNGRVYAVDGNAYFNRSGPRIVDSLEILAHLIHPQLFAKTAQPEAAVCQPFAAISNTQ